MSKIKRIEQANHNDYYTVEEASEKLGVKPPVLRNYLYQKKLTTYKFKTLTLLSRKEVDTWGKRKRQ